MHTRIRDALMLLFVLPLLPACGSGDFTACATTDHEVHLDQKASVPDGIAIMLHHAERTCSVVGSNKYHAYVIVDDSHPGHDKPRPQHDDTHADESDAAHSENPAPTTPSEDAPTSPPLRILSIRPWMPAHGHGSTVAPTIDADDPSFFTVTYQMPGTWELTLELAAPSVTHTSQTVQYRFDVVE